jgi:hypothetical protein
LFARNIGSFFRHSRMLPVPPTANQRHADAIIRCLPHALSQRGVREEEWQRCGSDALL